MKRLLAAASLSLILALSSGCSALPKEKVPNDTLQPNFIVIFCDDLGYGDIGSFGHPTIRTPELDRMAREGQRWTNFYTAASVCTPSRAALMTGRLPIRSGLSSTRRVLFPDSGGGLPASEITLAEALQPLGYTSACIGKWHLGHLPQFLPTRNGFDYYFGIPYSNDMDANRAAFKGINPFESPRSEYWNVPLMRNEEIIERPADQNTLTQRYTNEAIEFIRRSANQPFFLYLAHSMVHVPLFASPEFRGKSLRGLYGDATEEIDWSTGQILNTLRELGLDERTLVVFTSDNGPWLTYKQQGGSAGLLRGGKGVTFEGGMREPALFWWPGTVPPASIESGIGTTMDLLPTFVSLAGGSLPSDRVYDGNDLGQALGGKGPSSTDRLFYYREGELYAVRKGPFKAHFITKPAYEPGEKETHDPPLLFNLNHDPAEKFDVSAQHPEIVEAMYALVREHKATLEPVVDQLAIRLPPGE